ncbi:MAG: hypothetical protein ACRD3F_01390 [Acidobacteriaceae bacterium]
MTATLRNTGECCVATLATAICTKSDNSFPVPSLFGKVIAYKCTACDKMFSMPLFGGAVSEDFPPPASIGRTFFRHTCEKNANSFLDAARYKCMDVLMALSDDDYPASYLLLAVYLLYNLAVVVAIGIVVGVFFYLFR